MNGLSLRVVARKYHVSKEAVRQWMLKFEEAFAEKKLSERKERPVILLEETRLKRHGRIVYVSLCLDQERREVISTQCMSSISIVRTVGVTKEALKTCTNENPLLIVDHAPWYKSAFEWIRGIEYIQKMFGIRNYIERWYRTFKQRTKRFFSITSPYATKKRNRENWKVPPPVCLLVQPHAATRVVQGESAVLVILTVLGGRQERAC